MAEVYVDPSIAADSGAGTIGDPFGDLQYALDNTTQGASGDRFNIKAGTDEVLGASLSLATYGTPTYNKPLIFQGYTSAADDGGIGGISGGGSYSIYSGSASYLVFKDLHLHNSGSVDILDFSGINCYVVGCEIDNTTGIGVDCGQRMTVAGCYIHDIGGTSQIDMNVGTIAYRNFLDNTDTKKTSSFIIAQGGGHVIGNFILTSDTTGTRHGISTNGGIVAENTIVHSGTPGSNSAGIQLNGNQLVVNNYVEGFSSSGCKAIGAVFSADYFTIGMDNAAYNNTTNFGSFRVDGGNNDSLGSSGIVSTSDLDPAASAVTGMHEDAWPQSWPGLTTSTAPKADKGASQAGAGAGGSSVYRRVARLLGG